jgi:hypothetical protein
VELNQFIEWIRQRVFGEQPFSFQIPKIKWEQKEGHKYRPLCQFSLEDNIISSLTARYLREFCNPSLDPSSYAFRARDQQGRMPTHHKAFESIWGLKSSAPEEDVYVAECDIRGFYDTVDHQVALDALQSVVDRATAQRRDTLHVRAAHIFRAYLDCYSFPHSVLAENTLQRLKDQDSEGLFPWPEEDLLKYHANPRGQRIGVPQGGAISCVIANIVLDLADNRVRAVGRDTGVELKYYRYCDDMILLSRSQSVCRTAFQAYLGALDELKLPYHEPKSVTPYGKDFWTGKSRSPYCWTGRKGVDCVPWVQFVGYQIRYDGLVRIARKSIK